MPLRKIGCGIRTRSLRCNAAVAAVTDVVSSGGVFLAAIHLAKIVGRGNSSSRLLGCPYSLTSSMSISRERVVLSLNRLML